MTLPSLREAIDTFNANDLGTILRLNGCNDIPKSKEGKTRLWQQQMSDPAHIQQALNKLPARCRQALELLQTSEGELRTRRFLSMLERSGNVEAERKPGHASAFSPYPSRPELAANPTLPGEILAALLKNGLVWTHTLPEGSPANARIGFEGGRYVYIPAEVARHLPPPPAHNAAVLPQIAQTLPGSARTCQRELYLMWSAASENAFYLTNAELLRMADFKRVAGQMLIAETITTGSKESDYRRIFFLRRLASALGLLKGSANSVSSAPQPGFFSEEAAERVRLSFQSWRDGAWWNELWATYVEGKTRAAGKVADFASPKIGEARRKILEALALLTKRQQGKPTDADIWVTLDAIADYLRDRDEEFLVERETAERQYGGYYAYGSAYRPIYSPYQYNALGWTWEAYLSNEEQGWQGVERAFIQAVLTEGLYWLGLVDLGYARPVTPEGGTAPADLSAVRLTHMGRWLLLNGPRPAIPEESGRVVLQPNFRIFAFDPISDSVLVRLDSFANRLNAERAIEYELNRESIYRAQLAGQSVGAIKAWLEQVTAAPLPQNVARDLDEWQSAFEQIVIRARVGWLETASPELADAMLADPMLRAALIKRVTPTGFIIHADQVETLERALLAVGELPARSSDPATARHASITLSAEGAIQLNGAVPSLYIHAHLHPFCERTPVGWRITAASVARALVAGLDAAAILAILQDMAVNGVPEALQARIKAWSQHYGRVVIQTVLLAQFRDQDALDELLDDPELARHLRPFKPEARLGLATLKPESLAAVRDLLLERGVEVT